MNEPASAEEWARLRSLFDAACVLAPTERAAFLATLPAESATLRPLLAAMLAAESTDDGFLEPPVRNPLAPDLVGTQVAGYRIVRLVASGGMGAVWEAEQDEPRRRVALKTMHAGLTSARSRRRFRFESELLATLRHPAIAQVYSAGVLEAPHGAISVPWFALEYVEDARPLTVWAAEQALDLEAKLRLFQTVCGAIQHAHQRGVIHRDLKPANLLVDRNGQVKVIDFGVARLVDPDQGGEADAASRTRHGEVVGTLETMSPEQVDGRHDEVDARSDVYALGCLLYVLTSGREPHALAGVPLPEAARRIREDDPPPPSRVAAGLPPEIDWIVATALAKEPARRYASASELAREIQRVLDREPVLASPPSRTYRLRKFWQRNRVSVVAAVLVLLVALLGVGAAAWGMLQRERALAAERAARSEARLKESFSHWFLALFSNLLPEEVDGKPLDRKFLLTQATTWVRGELTQEPQLASQLLRAVGQVHAGFGEFQEARATLLEAVSLARKGGTPADFDLAEALARFGQLARRMEDSAAAEEALREALAIEERLFGADNPKLGPILNELGVLLATARPDDARGYYERTYRMIVARHGEESGDAALVLANLAMIEVHAHRYEAARESLERALERLERSHGAGDPRLGAHLSNYAGVLRQLGLSREALRHQVRDLEITTTSFGPTHAEVGMAQASLAVIHESLGDHAKAFAAVDKALEIFRAHFAAAHDRTITARTTRARLLAASGDLPAAKALLLELRALEPATPKARRARLAALLVLGDLERREGRATEGRAIAEAVLADRAAADDAKLRVDAEWLRAFAFLAEGKRDLAAAARSRALAILPPATRAGAGPHFLAELRYRVLLGEVEAAAAAWKAAIARGYDHAFVRVDPEFVGIRGG